MCSWYTKLPYLRQGLLGNNIERRELSFLPESCRMSGTDKRKEFSEQKLLGYSPKEIYTVVADINHYKDFLPWCKESLIVKERPGQCIAKLAVGFPPLVEKYTSLVIMKPYSLLRSISTDGKLFSHLETTWEFHPGPKFPTGYSSIIHISTIFEFHSIFYASLGTPIFEEVAKTLAQAFEARCHKLYGPDHLKTRRTQHLNISHTNS